MVKVMPLLVKIWQKLLTGNRRVKKQEDPRETCELVGLWWHALVRNVLEDIHLLTVWNCAGVVFSGHKSETCNYLREPRKVLEEKKAFDEDCWNDNLALCAISKTVKEGMNAAWCVIQCNSQHYGRWMINWTCTVWSREQQPTLNIVKGSNIVWDNYLSSFQVDIMHCSIYWEVR